MNGTNGVITDAGHIQRRIHGNYEIALNLTVDGGFSIGVTATGSPHRYDELSYTTGDVTKANLAYRIIAEGADKGVQPEGIRQALNDALNIKPKSLAEMAKQGTHRQVRPTMAGAHLTPLTAPQQRALNAAIDGVIYPGDGITTATLRSLDRKGYGSVAYEGRRKRVVSLVLNGRGLAAVSKAVA
ncbi:hypothetical protein QQG74_09245 [Micromonospora sp. FIMYZ51]|uniref:hypothetical protein n=1 Tax=Micromonospora sp. FIMYZ51 TaxID=3051832 RepID=UPI00311E2051